MRHTLLYITITSAVLLAGCGKDQQANTEETSVSSEAEAIQTESKAVAEDSKKQMMGNDLVAGVNTESLNMQSSVLVEEARQAAMKAASSVDWANLSWNDVSKIPYSDKDKLLAWAAPQIDALKDQLTKAALTKGKMSLSGLSDTGWQGTLKSTVSALESVRNSSPETWNMARDALISAFKSLQKQVAEYTGEG